MIPTSRILSGGGRNCLDEIVQFPAAIRACDLEGRRALPCLCDVAGFKQELSQVLIGSAMQWIDGQSHHISGEGIVKSADLA